MTDPVPTRLLDAIAEHLLDEPDDLTVTAGEPGGMTISGRSHEWLARAVPLPGAVPLFLLTPLPVIVDGYSSTLLALPGDGPAVVLRTRSDLDRLIVRTGPDLPDEAVAAIARHLESRSVGPRPSPRHP